MFYRETDGSKPLGEFIKSLDVKLRVKVVASLHLLEEYGIYAREPLSKHLEEGIFEIRIKESKILVRILYFFDDEKIIIATHGFVKKTRKTPRREIKHAKQIREQYCERKAAGTYE